MMTTKFRASYSVLNTWVSGDWQRAIKMYFKLEKFITPAMAEGSKYHEGWEKEIAETKCLPSIFGMKPLKKPSPELKLVVELAEWLDLVGVIDCWDQKTGVIYEFKTGKKSSESYASDMQVGVYALLMTAYGSKPQKAEIHHYDQYTRKVDMSIVWLSDILIDKALNWVATIGSEMHNYLVENKLYEKFKRQ